MNLKNKYAVFFGALFCCFLWGSAFPIIKMGYEFFSISSDDTASQILFAGVRFFLAGILAVIIGSIISGKLLLPKKSSLKMISVLAFFQTFLQYILFYIGLARTTGVKASIIDGASAFIAILIASLIFRQEKLTKRKILACVIGFAGVIAANLSGGGELLGAAFFGDSLILASAVAYAFSSVLIKKYSEFENPLVLSGYQFALGGAVMILCGLLGGGRLSAVNTNGILCLLWLAFVSAGAYSLWGLLLKYNKVSSVTVYSFMIPVFGVLLSAAVTGEYSAASGINVIIALVLVSAGILMINISDKDGAGDFSADR